jgi:cell volume regulation protein A
MAEPRATALLLLAAGILIAVSAVVSRTSGRTGVPAALLFLLIGMVAGSDNLGLIHFDDYQLTFRAGTAALVVILFDGGLNTPWASVRGALRPAAVLATLGVVGTAAVAGLTARLFGFGWSEALLLGAIVSPTDAAAVFSVLRGSGVHLKKRVGMTLELESGLNDPMAVLLTLTLTQVVAGSEVRLGQAGLGMVVELAVGAALGAAIGYGGRLLLRRVRLAAGGLYPVLTLALALLSFAAPTLLHGSGFLAVYAAALVLGNGPMPYQAGILRVHDSVAWLAQVGMFLLLGLLVNPSHLPAVAAPGLGIGLVLAFLARPLVAAICLIPFRFSLRETLYVGWVGLRGAVPIILATFPVLARIPQAERLFEVVFFVVVVNAVVPGATVRFATSLLGMAARAPPPTHAVLEITSTQQLNGEIVSFHIEPASAAAGSPISELPFPEDSAVMLVVRGADLVAPRGGTVLQPGDHVHVFCKPADRAFVQLLLGRPEEI